MDLFSQVPPDKELLKAQANIKRLFFSGNEESQIIAIQQCSNFKVSKGQLIFDYMMKDWKKSKIINDVAEKYASGHIQEVGYVFWYTFPSFLGFDIKLIDCGREIEFHGCVGTPLAQWEGKRVDQLYRDLHKSLKKRILTQYKTIFLFDY